MPSKAPGSKNVDDDVERPVFFDSPFGLAVSFIDQFIQPRSREEAVYLHDLSASMEASPGTREVPLSIGELVVEQLFLAAWPRGVSEEPRTSARAHASAWNIRVTADRRGLR